MFFEPVPNEMLSSPIVESGVTKVPEKPLVLFLQLVEKLPSGVLKPVWILWRLPSAGATFQVRPAAEVIVRPPPKNVSIEVGAEDQPCAWLTRGS